MRRTHYLLLLMLITSTTAFAESVAGILKPYQKMKGVEKINIMKQNEFLEKTADPNDEFYGIRQTIKLFNALTIPGFTETQFDDLERKLSKQKGLKPLFNTEKEDEEMPGNSFLENMDLDFFCHGCGFAREKGNVYTELVYVFMITDQQACVIVHIKGELPKEKLQLLLPQVNYH